MDGDELRAWLRLGLTPGVGSLTGRRLLAAFGLPQQVFLQSTQALKDHTTAAQAGALACVPEALDAQYRATTQWLETNGPHGEQRSIITLGDPRYPPALLQTEDPPLLLYALGPARFLQSHSFAAPQCLAVVGSRNPTPQGTENARSFASALCSAGWTVVSGLALGVDASAHEGALSASKDNNNSPATIAVVGTGLDRVYPRKNLELAHRIAQHGLLLSEYPLGTPPLAANFPKRNRIISGLSQGTLVVEAAPASGSLITARMASEQGREVFAIPGSIHAIQSRGCHALIRQGAKLVETVQDISEELPGFCTPISAAGSAPASPCKPHKHSAVLEAMGFDPTGLDALQARTGMDTPTLQVQLLELEIEGLVMRLPGGMFQRMAQA